MTSTVKNYLNFEICEITYLFYISLYCGYCMGSTGNVWDHSLQTTSEVKSDLTLEISDPNYLLVHMRIAYIVWPFWPTPGPLQPPNSLRQQLFRIERSRCYPGAALAVAGSHPRVFPALNLAIKFLMAQLNVPSIQTKSSQVLTLASMLTC